MKNKIIKNMSHLIEGLYDVLTKEEQEYVNINTFQNLEHVFQLHFMSINNVYTYIIKKEYIDPHRYSKSKEILNKVLNKYFTIDTENKYFKVYRLNQKEEYKLNNLTYIHTHYSKNDIDEYKLLELLDKFNDLDILHLFFSVYSYTYDFDKTYTFFNNFLTCKEDKKHLIYSYYNNYLIIFEKTSNSWNNYKALDIKDVLQYINITDVYPLTLKQLKYIVQSNKLVIYEASDTHRLIIIKKNKIKEYIDLFKEK